MFTLAKRFDDEGEVEEAEEEDIEFLEAGEDSAEAFESPEEWLDLVRAISCGAVDAGALHLPGGYEYSAAGT